MKKITFLLLQIYLIAFITSCSNQPVFDEEDISISLPPWPPQNSTITDYPELSRWKVTVASAAESEVFYVYPDKNNTQTEPFNFTVKKNQPFCLTAKPITIVEEGKESAYFFPCGYLYPYHTDAAGQLIEKATWEQGFLADTICKIIFSKKETGISNERLNKFLKSFNWKKAEETIESKLTEINPWLIDTTKLLENLCYGNFKSSYLNVTGTFTYNLSTIFPNEEIKYLSPFIPENEILCSNPQIKLKKNVPTLLSDGKTKAAIICCTSAKKMSLEFIYMPIYIEDI